MRDFLTKSAIACPHQPARAPCPILPVQCSISDLAAAAGHSARCPKTAPPEPDPAGIRLRNAPESALVFQRTTQVPNGATLRAASATAAAILALVIADTVALHRALQLDDSTLPVRDAGSLVPPAGPEMAGSTLPAIVNLRAAGGAVSPVRAAALAEDPRSGLTR